MRKFLLGITYLLNDLIIISSNFFEIKSISIKRHLWDSCPMVESCLPEAFSEWISGLVVFCIASKQLTVINNPAMAGGDLMCVIFNSDRLNK